MVSLVESKSGKFDGCLFEIVSASHASLIEHLLLAGLARLQQSRQTRPKHSRLAGRSERFFLCGWLLVFA